MQLSSLRYDDDQALTGEAHFELGVAYATASEGLPRDLARARAHFEQAHERHYPGAGSKLIASTAKRLDAATRAVFDAVFA